MDDNQMKVNNPLGYSMIQEYQQDDDSQEHIKSKANLLKNKQNSVWVSDESITQCQRCQNEFGFMLRKHHCRCCGQIFCYECTPFRKQIPASWQDRLVIRSSNIGSQTDLSELELSEQEKQKKMNKLHRLCYACNDQVELLISLDRLIQVFSLVQPDLSMMCKMAGVCQLWYNLVQFFMGKIRNLQYKPINHRFSSLERNLLWVNRHYWIGHSHYTLLLLKSLTYNSFFYRTNQHSELVKFLARVEEAQKPQVNCLNLMCTRNCCQALRPYHAIILSDFCCRKPVCQELHDFTLRVLSRINNEELILYLPFLVEKLIYHRVDSPFSWGNFLIERAKLSSCTNHNGTINNLGWLSGSTLALELYWNLIYKERETRHAIYRYYLNKFLNTLDSSTINLVNKSHSLVKILENCPQQTHDLLQIKNYFRKMSVKGLIIPMDSTLRVESLLIHLIDIKKSYTRPIMIPFNCRRRLGELNENITYTILYKFENVRQDYLVLKVIRLMKYLLHTFEGLDLEIVDYAVCPLTGQTGIIQIVPECKTTYEIKEKMKFTIWNYIEQNNPNETVETLRRRFVRTCATYCVVTYLLGVGDRHLDNIMITRDGKLFHIDYGFVLGSDPKPLSQPKIRITEEMVDALGGYESTYYQEFIQLCNRIYQGLRGHLSLFICLLSMLTKNEEEYRKLVELLTTRFMPGETQRTTIVQLENEIFRSTQQNLSETIVDFFHYHKKENTISSVLDSTASTAQTVINTTSTMGKKVGGMLSGWWGNSAK